MSMNTTTVVKLIYSTTKICNTNVLNINFHANVMCPQWPYMVRTFGNPPLFLFMAAQRPYITIAALNKGICNIFGRVHHNIFIIACKFHNHTCYQTIIVKIKTLYWQNWFCYEIWENCPKRLTKLKMVI